MERTISVSKSIVWMKLFLDRLHIVYPRDEMDSMSAILLLTGGQGYECEKCKGIG